MELNGQRFVITGGSGFLGLSLAQFLSRHGADVVIVSRSRPKPGPWRGVHWDGRHVGDWAEVLDGAAGVVNLAGRSVDCIKTPDHCDEILRSRVESTRAVGYALQQLRQPPPVWVQMSTAHIYGDSELRCDEDAPFGFGLAPAVGQAWEAACRGTSPDGVRVVILRTSFVLGYRGGALSRLAWLARRGLGGKIGHGRQGISWIHETDMNRLFERALTNPAMAGAYLATAPNPISNHAFMQALRRAVRCPIGLPAPTWGVRFAAPLLMQTDPELALYGRYCVSRRLAEEGFEFQWPEIESALADLLATGGGCGAKNEADLRV